MARYREEVPVWFKINKPILFDDSTARTRFLQNTPVNGIDQGSLNSTQEIRFEYNPSTDQVIHLADKNTCLRMRLQYYFGTGNNGKYQGATPPAGFTGDPNADITFKSTFIGHMFREAYMFIGPTFPVDSISSFRIWFQLMCNLQPLEFKEAIGQEMGYIPDLVSGRAVDNFFPYLLLTWTGTAGTTLASGATSNTFGIVATVTPTAAVAANATVLYTIPNTNIQINLFTTVALAANVTVTLVFQIAIPFSVPANTIMPYAFSGGVLMISNSTGAAINANAGGLYISMHNTTSTALQASTLGNTPVVGSTMQYPVFVNGINNVYEPGYDSRKITYNTVIPNPTSTPVGARTIEVLVPLYYLFGFVNSFNRLCSNLGFAIKLIRETEPSPFFGVANTQGFLSITEFYLQIQQVVPNDEVKVDFNRAIEQPVNIGYLTPFLGQYVVTGSTINQTIPYGTYKPDYVFVIFKLPASETNPQVNDIINHNADIQRLQVFIGGEAYPTIDQDAKWGTSTGNTTYTSVGVNRFYEQYKTVCEKLTGQCSMTFTQYRDLYPIFAFDLTAQAIKVKNTSTQINIVGMRNISTAGTITLNMHVIVLYEKFLEVDYLKNTVKERSSNFDQNNNSIMGKGLYSNV